MTNLPALEQLWCPGNLLSDLDLSQQTDLRALNCSNNQLTSLDISKCRPSYIECMQNKISNLDLPEGMYLGLLRCEGNSIKTLDFTQVKLSDGFALTCDDDVTLIGYTKPENTTDSE